MLVVVDTLRRDILPEDGFDLPTSGAMAPFFAEAVRFERAIDTFSAHEGGVPGYPDVSVMIDEARRRLGRAARSSSICSR